MATVPRPLPTLPGVYYARVEGTFEGLPASNTLAFQTNVPAATGAADLLAAQTVANAIAAHWPTLAEAVFHNSYSADLVSVYALNTPTGAARIAAMTATGGVTGAMQAATTAKLIKLIVDRRGKGSQGRMFLSPVPFGDVNSDGRTLTTATITGNGNAYGVFESAVIAELVATATPVGVWQQTVISRKGTGASYPVVNFTVEPQLSTQRKRAQRKSA